MSKYCPYCGEKDENKFSFGAIKCMACEDKHKRQATAWVKSGKFTAAAKSEKKKNVDYDYDFVEEENE